MYRATAAGGAMTVQPVTPATSLEDHVLAAIRNWDVETATAIARALRRPEADVEAALDALDAKGLVRYYERDHQGPLKVELTDSGRRL